MKGLNVIEIEAKRRWEVVFRDGDSWQLGVYVPENESIDDVKILEKHDCPEMFYLVRGRIVLVLSSGDELEEVEMEKGKIYIVECWHNAYRPEGSPGVALVVERPSVKTEYRPISEFKR